MAGLDINVPRITERLRLYLRGTAPDGYETWLDRNLSQYDPVARSWRLRENLPLRYRSFRTFKCWDDKCLHYIYGFSNEEERDQHVREHVSLLKRDSGLSISGTPPLIFPEQFVHRRDYSTEQLKHSPSLYLPRPSGGVQLASPPAPGWSRDPKDSLRAYSLHPEENAPPRELRGSVDSEVDPLLPPLKRSRVGQSRLESIEELRLLSDHGQCLRCRILRNTVSYSQLYYGRENMKSDSDHHSATPMTLVLLVPTPALPRMGSGPPLVATGDHLLPSRTCFFHVCCPQPTGFRSDHGLIFNSRSIPSARSNPSCISHGAAKKYE